MRNTKNRIAEEIKEIEKIDIYKIILIKLNIDRKDDEANKLLDEMLKNGVKKKSKIYTNFNKEVKEELLGFILTLSSDYWDIVLDTENGVMKTILHSYEYGDISEKGKINEDLRRIITEIVAEKLGIETNKTIGLVSK